MQQTDTDPATANAIGRVAQFFEAQMIDDRM
jgi:hypothetical protein